MEVIQYTIMTLSRPKWNETEGIILKSQLGPNGLFNLRNATGLREWKTLNLALLL